MEEMENKYWIHDNKIYTTELVNWEEISKDDNHEIFRWETPWVVHVRKWDQEFYLCALGYHGRGNKLKANIKNIHYDKHCWVNAMDLEKVVEVKNAVMVSEYGTPRLSKQFLRRYPEYKQRVSPDGDVWEWSDLRGDQEFIKRLISFGLENAFTTNIPTFVDISGDDYCIFTDYQGEYIVTPKTIKWKKIQNEPR